MKITDIVKQLKAVLPKYTDAFTTNLSVTSLVRIGSVVTATTSTAHNLIPGSKVLVVGAKTPIQIDSLIRLDNYAIALCNTKHNLVKGLATTEIAGADQTDYNGIKKLIWESPVVQIDTITIAGNIATVTTLTPHGFLSNSNFDIEISGVSQVVYNKTATLNSIISPTQFTYTVIGAGEDAVRNPSKLMEARIKLNAYTFIFEVANNPATPATGTIYQLSEYKQGYNGYQTVATVPTSTTFTYSNITLASLSPAQGTIIARTSPNIAGSINLEKADEFYKTKFALNKKWIFVVLGDEIMSKNNRTLTDATSYNSSGSSFREQNIQTLEVYLFFPATNELLQTSLVDESRSYKKAIYKSLLGFKAPSILTEYYSSLVPIKNGSVGFNGSYYVHQYLFEATNFITNNDIIDQDDLVAFRAFDIDILDKNSNVVININGQVDQEF